MKTFFYLVLLTGILASCKKEKENLPPVGEYIGEFRYNSNNLDPQIVHYKITSSEKDSLIVNWGWVVYKLSDKKLEGWIPANQSNTSYQITGGWKKVKKEHVITGTFAQEFSYLMGGYTLYGTFEIKSQ